MRTLLVCCCLVLPACSGGDHPANRPDPAALDKEADRLKARLEEDAKLSVGLQRPAAVLELSASMRERYDKLRRIEQQRGRDTAWIDRQLQRLDRLDELNRLRLLER